MIELDLEQGSSEWMRARLALPTCSQAARILTPKTLKYSEASGGYRNRLLAEFAFGYPLGDDPISGWTIRGHELEPAARAWYAFEKDVDVREVGFVLRGDRAFGGSPDGLVGDDGILELKAPAASTHLGYVLDPSLLVAEYRAQCQSLMYVTRRRWVDLASFNPKLPKVLVRVERDESFLTPFHRALGRFLSELNAAKRKLLEMGVNPPEWIQRPEPEGTHEALIDQMYGPEPAVDSEPFEAMPSELLRLKQLASLHEDLSTDDRLTIQHVIERRDGHGVQTWTRRLERLVSKREPAA